MLPVVFNRNCKKMGFILTLLSLAAWMTEWVGLVNVCPYCQVERTIIGILGIMMMLEIRPFIANSLTVLFGFIGMQVATSQLFMHFHENSYSEKTPMVIAALIIMTGQIVTLLYRANNVSSEKLALNASEVKSN